MVEGLILGEIHLSAVRTLPQEERSVLHLVLKFRVVGYVDAFIDCYLVLLAAFAAWGDGLVDD